MTEDISQFKRTRRKACIMEKAKRSFGFDFYKEFAIYKFAMGFGLSKDGE